VSDQSEYHLFDRLLERENFPAMQSYGMAALVYSPLAQGLLAGKFYGGPDALPDAPKYDRYRNEPDHVFFSAKVQTALGKLIEMSRQYGKTPAQLALAFVMKHPVTAIPIVAPSNAGQLADCLGACDIVVDGEMAALFDAINPPGDKLHGQRFNSYNHGPTARWY
jgi:aryl-alcohol dehydrogenase (NADP+)